MALIGRGGLRARLVLVTMLTATVVSGVVVAVLQVYLAALSEADSAGVARARADAVAATVRVSDGRLTVLEAGVDSLDREVWVFDARGGLVEGTTTPSDDGDLVRTLGRDGRDTTQAGSSLMLAARSLTVDGVGAVVVAGVDLAPYESSERRTLLLSLGLGCLVVVAAGAAADAAARVSLGRVRAMVRSAQEWEEHDRGNRFAPGEGSDEISELGRTLDHLLDRIAEALRSERRLSDEFAHELRTPLSVIRAEAELLLAGSVAGDPDALRTIVHEAGRADAVVQAMLDAARSRESDDRSSDLRDVLRSLPVATRSGLVVRRPAAGRPVIVGAPPTLVVAAMGPVLDNAARFARNAIDLELTELPGEAVVTVRDDGPGFDPDLVGEVTRPGFRSGEGGSGAGLGLAVSSRLMASVGGRLHALPGPPGRVELRLPLHVAADTD
ncbi:MAG: HAMP domain-containing sensor histidine kinase [Nocardioidaceae bacterium]